MNLLAEFLGRGVRFPVVLQPEQSGFSRVEGADVVSQAIRTILLTEPGERIGRPNYGCGLRRFLFAPNTVATRALIQKTIVDALRRDERRIAVDTVSVQAVSNESTLIDIQVEYHLRGEALARSFAFGFDLNERRT